MSLSSTLKKLAASAVVIGGMVLFLRNVDATTAFNSAQVGSSPVAGSVLQTNGATSTWVSTSSLGIVGGGGGSTTAITSANAFITVTQVGTNATLTATSAYVGTLANNITSGGIDFSAATGTAITGVLHSLAISQFTNDSHFISSSTGNTLYLQIANNLSDLTNTSTARTNLGLGSIATHPSTDYITSSTTYVASVANTSTAGGITFSASNGSNITGVLTSLAITQFTGVLAIANGGTNATSAAAALSNLGGISTSTYNASITIATAAPLGGGAKLANNGYINLTCTGCLTAALTSLNGDTSAAQKITGSGPISTSTSSGVTTIGLNIGSYLGLSGSNLTASTTLASTTVSITNWDATTTGQYGFFMITGGDFGLTIDNISCHNVAATTTYNFIRATSSVNTTGQTVATSTCGVTSNTIGSTAFTTTTIPTGTFLIGVVSSTVGTPTRDEIRIHGFKT